jgi:hypothetical protein
MRHLWVFGNSHCLPHGIQETGWPDIVSQKLALPLHNLAQPAADNFFIYQCFLENLSDIGKDDVVIVGWSHYSRKSFVRDSTNINQTSALPSSIIYPGRCCELVRGVRPAPDITRWLNLSPAASGVDYYDIWFRDYYSKYEQTLNQQAYMHSVELACPGRYIPFFFSKESVDTIQIPSHAGFIVDFIADHKVMISRNDGHLNPEGHRLWAEKIIQCINHTF